MRRGITGVRDPLCTQATPYDMLGIDQRADRGSIVRAFAMALAKRQYGQQELQQARTTLLRPEDRVLVDILYYDADALARLQPNPLEDPACLAAERRQATAEAWRLALAERFPDIGIIHSLALLWYWWAEHGTRQVLEAPASEMEGLLDYFSLEVSSQGPSLPARWRRAIGYWAPLLGSPRVWAQVTGLAAEGQVSATREEMGRRLRDGFAELQRFTRRLRDGPLGGTLLVKHRDSPADQFESLQWLLRNELETTRHMLACGRSPLGDGLEGVGCGRVLLEELNLLSSVRGRVEQYCDQSEGDRHIGYVRNALSAHWKVAQLVSGRHWDEALAAVDQMPADAPQSREVQRLRVEALLGKARGQMNLGDTIGAVMSWAEVIKLDSAGGQGKRATEALMDACRKLRDCPDSQLEMAANVLKRARSALPGNQALRRLSSQIGDRLCTEAISTINRVQRQVQAALEEAGKVNDGLRRRWRSTWQPAFDRAIEQLERARFLGSERAADQVEVGRRIREQFVTLFQEEPSWVRSVRLANAAAMQDDWSTAVASMRSALGAAPISEKERLRPQLAVCLHNQALATLNSSLIQDAMGSGPSHTVLGEVGRMLVRGAVELLEEAQQLDPTEGHVQESLRTARMMERALRVGGGVPTPTSSNKSHSLGEGRGLGRSWVGLAIVLLALISGWLTDSYATPQAAVSGAAVASVGIAWGMARGGGLAKLTIVNWLAVVAAAIRMGMGGKAVPASIVFVVAFLALGLGHRAHKTRA